MTTFLRSNHGIINEDHYRTDRKGEDENFDSDTEEDYDYENEYHRDMDINWSNEIKEELRDLAEWAINDFSFFDIKQDQSHGGSKRRSYDDDYDDSENHQRHAMKQMHKGVSKKKVQQQQQDQSQQSKKRQNKEKQKKTQTQTYAKSKETTGSGCVSDVEDTAFNDSAKSVVNAAKDFLVHTTCTTEESVSRNCGGSYDTSSPTYYKRSAQTKMVKGLSTKGHSKGRTGGSGGKNRSDVHPEIVLITPSTRKTNCKKRKENGVYAWGVGGSSKGSGKLKSIPKRSSSSSDVPICDVSTISGSEDSSRRFKVRFWRN